MLVTGEVKIKLNFHDIVLLLYVGLTCNLALILSCKDATHVYTLSFIFRLKFTDHSVYCVGRNSHYLVFLMAGDKHPTWNATQ